MDSIVSFKKHHEESPIVIRKNHRKQVLVNQCMFVLVKQQSKKRLLMSPKVHKTDPLIGHKQSHRGSSNVEQLKADIVEIFRNKDVKATVEQIEK